MNAFINKMINSRINLAILWSNLSEQFLLYKKSLNKVNKNNKKMVGIVRGIVYCNLCLLGSKRASAR